MAYNSVNKVPVQPVTRYRTTLSEIDWLYGKSKDHQGKIKWGFPKSSISLWAGEPGVGKSRLAVEICRTISRYYEKCKVLYFQNESPKGIFAQKIRSDGKKLPSQFYISDSNTMATQINDIKRSQARVVIVDSIQMLTEFGNGADSYVKKIYDAYVAACRNQCHIIFLCQLNDKGEARGGKLLPHLVDSVFKVEKVKDQEGVFSFKVGNKHRYGKTGKDYCSLWKHTDKGVICLSEERKYDKSWCSTHNLKYISREEEYKIKWDKIEKDIRAEVAADLANDRRIEQKEYKKIRNKIIATTVVGGVARGVISVAKCAVLSLGAIIALNCYDTRQRKK